MELISHEAGQLIGMTNITPSIELNYAPERAQFFRASNKRKLAKGLLISTLLHLIGLAIVIFSTTFESGVTPVQKPAPISATLYFPPVSVKQPVISPADQVESEPKVDVTPPPENDASAKDTSRIDKPIATPRTSSPSVEENPVQETQLPEKMTIDSNATNNDAAVRNQKAGSLNLSPRAGAAQFFNQREQEVVAEEGLRAAKAHRQKIQSPDLVDTRKGEEDKSFDARPVKKVNCSGTTNKTLTILSGITGGTLECSKGSDYERFIDERVAKKPSK